MKKLHPLFYVFVCFMAISCKFSFRNNHTSVAYSNSDKFYTMKANYDERKTRLVDEYLDKAIESRSNKMSFVNNDINGTVALNNRGEIHMQKSPGVLEIQLVKSENSVEAYRMVKSVCEGIKPILTSK
ncbi:hypothetical protein [Segetibacter sp.]|jgi:hypothetical protein|uniref:hypothetical protein n=1 Tax=Segetibacter sp. TaxID=2231182 RepID=UPI002634C99D|nr:hypothetical protein [Segetibacter sp.]